MEVGPRVVIHDDAAKRWLLFRRPVKILEASRLDEVVPVLSAVDEALAGERLHAAGMVSYEAAPAFDPALKVRPPGRLPLAWFGLFGEPEEVPPPRAEGPAPVVSWEPSVGEEAYRAAFREIKRLIAAGNTYQVNYSLRLLAPLDFDPWGFFAGMIRAQGPGFGTFIDAGDWAVASASPELFFRLDGDRLVSRPMKGTAPRGLGCADDRRKAAGLKRSVKNRAENLMIVDMVRNDLGRVAETGSVRVTGLFSLERYPTLWQMTSTVHCLTSAGLAGIFRAAFPPASVTGAPKASTMDIIARLENSPRGIYTGAVGFAGPGRRAQFNVAIRTLAADRREGRVGYGVGGGIVWDSRAAAELEECRTKARVVTLAWPEFSLLETMLWEPGRGYPLLGRHLARLAASARHFCRILDRRDIRRRLAALALTLPPVPHRVRLLVPAEGAPILDAEPLRSLPRPYRLGLTPSPVGTADPFLYHKTDLREVYRRALEGCPGCDDALLRNERGELTESCIANLVVELDGELVTPPVRSGLLPGIGRSLLLAQGRVRERVLRAEDLARCSRVLLVNAVRGMWAAELRGN